MLEQVTPADRSGSLAWSWRLSAATIDRVRSVMLHTWCDLLKRRVRDVSSGDRIAVRAVVMQQKSQRPVQFEITEQTRDELGAPGRDLDGL